MVSNTTSVRLIERPIIMEIVEEVRSLLPNNSLTVSLDEQGESLTYTVSSDCTEEELQTALSSARQQVNQRMNQIIELIISNLGPR